MRAAGGRRRKARQVIVGHRLRAHEDSFVPEPEIMMLEWSKRRQIQPLRFQCIYVHHQVEQNEITLGSVKERVQPAPDVRRVTSWPPEQRGKQVTVRSVSSTTRMCPRFGDTCEFAAGRSVAKVVTIGCRCPWPSGGRLPA